MSVFYSIDSDFFTFKIDMSTCHSVQADSTKLEPLEAVDFFDVLFNLSFYEALEAIDCFDVLLEFNDSELYPYPGFQHLIFCLYYMNSDKFRSGSTCRHANPSKLVAFFLAAGLE